MRILCLSSRRGVILCTMIPYQSPIPAHAPAKAIISGLWGHTLCLWLHLYLWAIVVVAEQTDAVVELRLGSALPLLNVTAYAMDFLLSAPFHEFVPHVEFLLEL